MKLDQQGEIEWSQLYGGFAVEEAAACIEVDDGYIIAADTNSVDADVNKQHNNRSIWLFKLDKEGKITCNETMLAAPDGGFLVAGFTDSKDSSFEEMLTEKRKNTETAFSIM